MSTELSPFVLNDEDRELLELLNRASMILEIFKVGIQQGRRIEFKPDQLRTLVATCEELVMSGPPNKESK